MMLMTLMLLIKRIFVNKPNKWWKMRLEKENNPVVSPELFNDSQVILRTTFCFLFSVWNDHCSILVKTSIETKYKEQTHFRNKGQTS